MTLREFVRKLIEIQLGMVKIHISAFEQLRNKAGNGEYQRGVQDCIDILNESLLTGMSITDDEIHKRERDLQAVLEIILANREDN